MDHRNVDIQAPASEGDTVTVRWTAHYTIAGSPDLEFAGAEFARFESDRIAHLWDELDPAAEKALGVWLALHGNALSG